MLNEFLESYQAFIKSNWVKAGYEKLTAVQLEAMPYILEGKDVIASSPTGTGKTIAYLLPLLEKINQESKGVQSVILAPSRELVMQILEETQKWAEGTSILAASFIGGANLKRQLEKLKKRPQIVIGTPGRINELIMQKKLKMHEVKLLVMDEGDQLLLPENKQAISNIVKSTLSDRQLVLFSATLSPEAIQKASAMMKKPELINITVKESPKVEYQYFLCDAREKIDVLRKLSAAEKFQALVFVRDIGNLSVLAEKLQFKGVSVGQLHSELKKEERAKAIKLFKQGEIQYLLVTDVAARGLDLQGLTHVIHYELPEGLSQFVHRSGRTGRLGSASGTVISIVTEREERKLKQICRELNADLHKKELVAGKIMNSK
ncbi:DEAD/DEAH box helicase [Bacillus sp. FJAT-49736]|uniref:DEAD/DEAH box helicase n=1 Tax=Bacillus sp. FJAT-49736 TaxID=2833582 RepID=UPI001BC9D711|nr:DEAD/DEAH box helicase [Bacillus sp. FJAT-49736]MBS4174977.1 DEAD/DEAH box helicase [Bacillus sp. FJAT-49736]